MHLLTNKNWVGLRFGSRTRLDRNREIFERFFYTANAKWSIFFNNVHVYLEKLSIFLWEFHQGRTFKQGSSRSIRKLSRYGLRIRTLDRDRICLGGGVRSRSSLVNNATFLIGRSIISIQAVASLTLVSPGPATDGVTLFFPKNNDDFF